MSTKHSAAHRFTPGGRCEICLTHPPNFHLWTDPVYPGKVFLGVDGRKVVFPQEVWAKITDPKVLSMVKDDLTSWGDE